MLLIHYISPRSLYSLHLNCREYKEKFWERNIQEQRPIWPALPVAAVVTETSLSLSLFFFSLFLYKARAKRKEEGEESGQGKILPAFPSLVKWPFCFFSDRVTYCIFTWEGMRSSIHFQFKLQTSHGKTTLFLSSSPCYTSDARSTHTIRVSSTFKGNIHWPNDT